MTLCFLMTIKLHHATEQKQQTVKSKSGKVYFQFTCFIITNVVVRFQYINIT